MTLKEKHVTLSLRTTSRPSNGYFLQLTTVGNHHWGAGLATVAAVLFDGPDYVHTLGNLTEHDVLAVQPVGDSRGYKELRAVGVGAAVGHGQKTRSDVLLGEVLVAEFFAVDGLAAGSVLSGKVTALAHEAGDHSMEGRAFLGTVWKMVLGVYNWTLSYSNIRSEREARCVECSAWSAARGARRVE